MQDIATALQVVLDLARQNVVDELDNPEEHDRQMDAIAIIEELAEKQFGNS